MAGELLKQTDRFSYFGKYNGFRFCIPEIAEEALIANYSETYSFCDLEYAAKLTYMVHEVSFSPTPFTYSSVGLDEVSLESPIHYEKPRDELCGGGYGVDVSGSFDGTPPFFLDYYSYRIVAGFTPGTLYRIGRPLGGLGQYTNPPETGNESGEKTGSKTRYIFLNDYFSDGEIFSVYYDSVSQIDEAGYFISMHNDGTSIGTVTIGGKVFYEYYYAYYDVGTVLPRITDVTFYSFREGL